MRVKANQQKNNSNPNIRVVMSGRIYNTETSKVIGVYWNGLPDKDDRHMTETLYKKRNGEYFLHGAGGPMSPYASLVSGGGWADGWGVCTMSLDEAKQWGREHMDCVAYRNEFGTEE